MKVLHINCLADTLSTGSLIKDLYMQGQKQNICSYVAYSKGTSSLENSFCYSNTLERKIHALFSRITGRQAAFSTHGTKKLIAYIKSVMPDVIHLHNLHDNNINLKLLFNFLAKAKLKVVITLHDCWFFTGHCCHYTINNCQKWQTGCGGCQYKNVDIPNWFFDKSKQELIKKQQLLSKISSLHIVGVSKWITQQAKKSFLKDIANFHTVYNWVDTDVFRPQDKNMNALPAMARDKTILLSVAYLWTNGKGLEDFIKLSSILPEETIIVLVGNLPQGAQLNSKIINIPLVHDVQKLAQIYNCADIYLNFSYQETFGLCTAQAITCGLPVISYDNTANTEITCNRGTVVPNGDVEKAYSAIKENKEYNIKANSESLNEFSKENNCEKYFEIYNR